MDPELPKYLAAAADVAKKLSAEIDVYLNHLMKLKGLLDQAHPALDVVHKNIIAGNVPDSVDSPSVVVLTKAEQVKFDKAEAKAEADQAKAEKEKK